MMLNEPITINSTETKAIGVKSKEIKDANWARKAKVIDEMIADAKRNQEINNNQIIQAQILKIEKREPKSAELRELNDANWAKKPSELSFKIIDDMIAAGNRKQEINYNQIIQTQTLKTEKKESESAELREFLMSTNRLTSCNIKILQKEDSQMEKIISFEEQMDSQKEQLGSLKKQIASQKKQTFSQKEQIISQEEVISLTNKIKNCASELKKNLMKWAVPSVN